MFDKKTKIYSFMAAMWLMVGLSLSGCKSEQEQKSIVIPSKVILPPPPRPRSSSTNYASTTQRKSSSTQKSNERYIPDICRHDGMLETISQIRRVCIKGKCDLDKLLSQVNKLQLNEFISMMHKFDQKTTFFFRTGQTTLDQAQVSEKLEQLIANLTTMIEDYDNTVSFIIAKASKKGDRIKNRKLSTLRAQTVFNLIDSTLQKRGETARCEQIYRTYVGAEGFDFNEMNAKQTNYINDSDIKRAKRYREKLEDYINQSAVIFNYPCFNQMC
jgi:hypothetical protein